MKIYRVSIVDKQGGWFEQHKLWKKYTSARNSFIYWRHRYAGHDRFEVTLTAIHAPEPLWQPVSAGVESTLGKMRTMWHDLKAADPTAAQVMLAELMRSVPKPEVLDIGVDAD